MVIVSEVRREEEATQGQEALRPDYIYVGQQMPDLPVEGQRYIVDFNAFGRELQKHMDVADYMFPIFPYNAMPYISAGARHGAHLPGAALW